MTYIEDEQERSMVYGLSYALALLVAFVHTVVALVVGRGGHDTELPFVLRVAFPLDFLELSFIGDTNLALAMSFLLNMATLAMIYCAPVVGLSELSRWWQRRLGAPRN